MLTGDPQQPLILKERSLAPVVMHCCCRISTLHFPVCLLPSLEAQTEPYCSFVKSSHPLLRPCLLGPEGPAFSCEVAHLVSSVEAFPRLALLLCLVTITHTNLPYELPTDK
ncbi:hypothetical protein ATANTOWER_007897 [Ataeniobius toweri]|uniref:Uncharacterized protein n=1 Tax=Ataeniobius toweri TaxID=208326 RepID=A0ABU7ANS0_9TELE|nr:hypothetical protein [Ataeniobius toweri]